MKHLPKLGTATPSAAAVCGAAAVASIETTVAQCDCQPCLWTVYHFVSHQQNMLLARLRELAGITTPYRKAKKEGP